MTYFDAENTTDLDYEPHAAYYDSAIDIEIDNAVKLHKSAPEAVFVGREDSANDEMDAESSVKVEINNFYFWDEIQRSVPMIFVRSSLFSATEVKEKPKYSNLRLAVWDSDKNGDPKDWELIYTGVRLDQYDFAVWKSMMHLSRGKAVGEKIYATTSDILKTDNKTCGGDNITRVKGSLERLKDAHLIVKDHSVEISETDYKLEQLAFGYTGTYDEYAKDKKIIFSDKLLSNYEEVDKTSLSIHKIKKRKKAEKNNTFTNIIDNAEVNKKKKAAKHHCFIISYGMKNLYKKFSLVDLDVLKKLAQRPLALWLYHFYSSHDNPKPSKNGTAFPGYPVTTLIQLTGYSSQPLNLEKEDDQILHYDFKRTLKDNLNILEQVTKEYGKTKFIYARDNLESDYVLVTKRKSD
jgi:hypothetical protein